MALIFRSLVCAFAIVAFASFPALSPAVAADGKGEAAKPAPVTAADADAKADRSLREQEIYIPYEKLRGVFEKHGRGVFLPYEKFDELWKAAQDKTRPAAEPRPPMGAMITEIENEAVVAKDVVQVTAHLKIDLLAEGWHEVPLRLADAAIVRATIKNEPARILGDTHEDHRLLIEKKGKQPEQIELVLEYARAITRSPGQNCVSFQAPQAAVSRWKVRIPQAGVKVNLHPLIAATEVPPVATSKKLDAGGTPTLPNEKKVDETVILAFVGAAPEVRIDWTPKSEGATGLTALANVQSEQQVWIQEGIARTRTTLAYTISRAELNQIALEVPADFKVVNVFDPNVRQWSVEPPAAGSTVQKITAQLFEPAKTAQSVVVELEKIAGQKRVESLKLPVVKALNVGRQQGFVVAQVGSGLRAEATKTSGLLQVDANELPPTLRSAVWTFAYRYASVPFELELAVEEVAPRITVDSLVDVQLEPEKLTLNLTAVYTIERAGIFKLELDVPEGFEVRSVIGKPVAVPAVPGTTPAASSSAAEIDSFHVEGEKKNHLIVNLARKALGRVGLRVQLQRDLHEANLLTPTGKSAEIDLPLPQPTKTTVEHASGRLIVHAPESLRVSPAKADGLRPVSYQEATEGIAVERSPAGVSAIRPVLAFTFTQEPVVLRLTAERRKPQVTIRQLLVARIDEGVIKYQATFYYSIHFSGVKSLRIDVPADVAPLLRNTTAGIHEKTLDPPPADLDKNMVAWSLTGEGELLGEGQIDLVWEKKLDKLEVGKSLEVAVPRLVPRDVDRAFGQIVLTKAETLDFQEAEDIKGLRPIDPQRDLTTPVGGAARAFEFYDEWTLPVKVTRYELEEVKRTSIDRAVCRMVLTPAGETAVQAVYRIRSVRPWLAVQLPTDAAPDSDPVRINGQLVTLRKGEGDALVVPLLSANADEPFVLEIRYTVKSGRTLLLPTFSEDTAVQKVYLCAFVPPTQDVVGTAGSWAEDFQWRYGYQDRWMPFNSETHEKKVEWVCEGNSGALGAAKTFHFDGVPLIFSTLRPDAQSNVRLWTLDHQTLNAWIFGVVVLGGVVLVRTSLARRVIAVGVFVVALVLLGVFWPKFSLHVLGGPLFAAVAIVLLLWSIVGMFRLYRPLMALVTAFGTTGSAWVASRKEIASPPAAKNGGASHE